MNYCCMLLRCVVLLWAGAFFFSCSSNPYAVTNKRHKKQLDKLVQALKEPSNSRAEKDSIPPGDYWVGTTNFNLRKPNFVVIHHTKQESVHETFRYFTAPEKSVSAHYLIGSDGKVYQLLNDYLRAWHAGLGKWGSVTDLNSASIGIELDNDGVEPFEEAQIRSLLKLLARLKRDYGIPAENFIGHSDIAPVRKTDPGQLFPWRRLAEEGYGYWPQKDYFAAAITRDSTLLAQGLELVHGAVPDSFLRQDHGALRATLGNKILEAMSVEEALRIIGYDTLDLEAAIRAFKLHYIQKDLYAPLTREDKIMLYNVYKGSMRQ